jgi:DNA-binding NarL/FixJ family response regulator
VTAERAHARVLVADDDSAFRALVRALLENAGYTVLETDTGHGALEVAARQSPDLLILDVGMAPTSGYEVCRALRERDAELPILIVSGAKTEALDRVAGLLLGADDYLVKPFDPEELVARVRALLRRSALAAQGRPRAELTKRELEVLRLLAEGLDQRQIADRLVISPKTVATHIEHILGKLGVRSRAEAVAAAYRRDLVQASA